MLATHLPIQLAEWYGEKMCFVTHVSEEQSSVVRMTGGVQTLRNVSAYKKNPLCILMLNLSISNSMQRQTCRKPESMKNTAYHSPYDLVDNKVNDICIVCKIRNYDGTGTEHNYLFSCEMGDKHHGICFPNDESTMRVYGVADKLHFMDISNFPTSYYNPCGKDMWNVVCLVYGTTSGKSSLWVNHGKYVILHVVYR